jgi:hypothetical protein
MLGHTALRVRLVDLDVRRPRRLGTRAELARPTGRAEERQRRLLIGLGIIDPATPPAAGEQAAHRSALSAAQEVHLLCWLSLLCRLRHSCLSVSGARAPRPARWRGAH